MCISKESCANWLSLYSYSVSQKTITEGAMTLCADWLNFMYVNVSYLRGST